MERLIQILDDLDDIISIIGLASERIRKFLLIIVATGTLLAVQVGSVLLALLHPPIAMATALILFVALLFHSVTSSHLEIAR